MSFNFYFYKSVYEASKVRRFFSDWFSYFTRTAAVIILLALPTSAFAQLENIEEFPENGGFGGGANELTGGFQESVPLLSIGHGDGVLSHSMQLLGTSGTVRNNEPAIIVSETAINGNYSYNVILPGNSRVRFQSVDASPTNSSIFSEYINRGGSLDYLDGEYTYTSRSGARLIFEEQPDGYARITRLFGPDGNRLAYDYSGDDLSSIRNAYGYQLKFQLDGDEGEVRAINNADEACDPTALSCSVASHWAKATGGPDSTEFFDAENRRYNVSAAGGTTRFIVYPQQGMASLAVYNFDGELTSTTKLGFELTYSESIDDMGTPSDESDDERTFVKNYPDGSTTSVVSRVMGNMILSRTDKIGRVTSYSYTADNLIDTITMTRGDRVEYQYDSRGNVTQTTRHPTASSNLAPLVTKASYPTSCTSNNFRFCNKPIWTEDANGQRTDYTYHSQSGNILSVEAPSDGVNGRAKTEYSYVRLRANVLLPSGQTVPGPRIWKVSEIKRFAGVSDSEVTASISYDVNRNLVPEYMEISAAGVTTTRTTFTYDDYGNLTATDGPKSGTADKSFAFFDKLRRNIGSISIDPDGGGVRPREASRISYTDLGRVEKTETGTVSGGVGLTALNNMTVLQTQQSSFASVSALLEGTRLEADGTTFSRVDYSFDNMRRVECAALRMDPPSLANSHSDACTQTPNGMFGPDRISKRNYDLGGRLTEIISAYGTTAEATESATYLSYGPVHKRTDANGNTTTYTYDAFSRPKSVIYPNETIGSGSSNNTDFMRNDYDAVGRRYRVRRRDGTLISTLFDDLGRAKQANIGGNTSENVTITRDIAGRILGLSKQGSSFTFTYDSLGRQLTESSTDGTISFTYDPYGQRTSTTYPGADNFKVDYQYFVSGELKNISEGGQVLASYLYTDQGQRKSVTRGVSNNVTNYEYDAITRLKSLENDIIGTNFDQTLTYTHMPSNQLETATNSNSLYDPGVTTFDQNFVMNGLNQILSEDGLNYSYDDKGNLTASTGKSYTYDFANRLTQANDSNGLMANLTYDVASRLHTIDTPSGPDSRFAYDGQDMIAEYDDVTGALKTRFVHGPGVNEPLVRYDYTGGAAPVKEWYLMDRLGSVTGLADDTGTSTAVNSYSHHGQPSAGNEGRFQYTGQVWIEEIGLYYYKARFYDPQIKRFLNPDPIGYADGMNIYAYVHGDPINGTDPTGLTVCDEGDPDCEDEIIVVTRRVVIVVSELGGTEVAEHLFQDRFFGDVGGGGGGQEDSEESPCTNGATVAGVLIQGAKSIVIQGRVGGGLGVRASAKTGGKGLLGASVGASLDALSAWFELGTEHNGFVSTRSATLKGSLDIGNFSREGAIGVERTVFSDHRAPRDQDGNPGEIFDPVQSARNTSNFFGLSAEAQLGIGGKLALGIDLDELGQAFECDLIVSGGG